MLETMTRHHDMYNRTSELVAPLTSVKTYEIKTHRNCQCTIKQTDERKTHSAKGGSLLDSQKILCQKTFRLDFFSAKKLSSFLTSLDFPG